MKKSRRRASRLLAAGMLSAAVILWKLDLFDWAVGAAVLGLLLAWLGRPRTSRRRGAQSHVNADGAPKRAYRSQSAARAAADEYQRDFGERMNAYRCARGRHWHIGHSR